ncbi:hypothetical protein VTO42DRAFT_4942 [Malbranchea cinnamomea]
MGNSHKLQVTENPFIKPENREWSISLPASVTAPVSPPRRRKRHRTGSPDAQSPQEERATGNQTVTGHPDRCNSRAPTRLAAIEAGEVEIEHHLDVISAALKEVTRPPMPGVPRLAHDRWVDLYKRNQHPQGRHFVIHQHDHPVAGPHYDLRLQFSESSSISFAIMYGLPGNPNSRRLNRNATETRVHTLWSHLTEAASAATGSLIIWDTGEYSVLPYYKQNNPVETDQSRSELSDSSQDDSSSLSESEKLRIAFQQRKIRLRLHGTRLPPGYTITLRLTSSNLAAANRDQPVRKRRRKAVKSEPARTPSPETSDDDDGDLPSRSPSTSGPAPGQKTPAEMGTHSDADEDENIRRTNAYPGAVNSISSVHQRRWFLSLDRINSGFEKQAYHDAGTWKQRWVRKKVEEEDGTMRSLGFDPFYVRGPDVERSVVTGRLGSDVLKDEGVTGLVGRRGWRPVLV